MHSKIQSLNSTVRTSLSNFIERTRNDLSLSETMSLYSHLPPRFYLHFDIYLSKKITSREAMSLALIVNHLDPLLKFQIILELEEKCFQHSYEGQWEKVNSLIQLSSDEDKFTYLLEIEEISTRELFGNYQKLVTKSLKNIIFNDRRKQKVKRPQRKRGYNDHGSRRPEHKWLPRKIQESANPDKKDMRGRNLKVNRELLQIEEMKRESHSIQNPKKGELVSEK